MSQALQHLFSAVDHAQHANARQRLVRVAIARLLTIQAMRRAA